jgi:hypothetical protein
MTELTILTSTRPAHWLLSDPRPPAALSVRKALFRSSCFQRSKIGPNTFALHGGLWDGLPGSCHDIRLAVAESRTSVQSGWYTALLPYHDLIRRTLPYGAL